MYISIAIVFSISIIILSNVCFKIYIKEYMYKIELMEKAIYELSLGNINVAIYYAVNAGLPHEDILKFIGGCDD